MIPLILKVIQMISGELKTDNHIKHLKLTKCIGLLNQVIKLLKETGIK